MLGGAAFGVVDDVAGEQFGAPAVEIGRTRERFERGECGGIDALLGEVGDEMWRLER